MDTSNTSLDSEQSQNDEPRRYEDSSDDANRSFCSKLVDAGSSESDTDGGDGGDVKAEVQGQEANLVRPSITRTVLMSFLERYRGRSDPFTPMDDMVEYEVERTITRSEVLSKYQRVFDNLFDAQIDQVSLLSDVQNFLDGKNIWILSPEHRIKLNHWTTLFAPDLMGVVDAVPPSHNDHQYRWHEQTRQQLPDTWGEHPMETVADDLRQFAESMGPPEAREALTITANQIRMYSGISYQYMKVEEDHQLPAPY